MRQEIECPICLGALVLPDQMGDGPSMSYTTQDLHHAMTSLSKLPDHAPSKTSASREKDCLMNKFKPQSDCPGEANNMTCGAGAKSGVRTTVLLSCSHVFHQTCLATFEELTCEERPVCPVCRSLYQKRVLNL